MPEARINAHIWVGWDSGPDELTIELCDKAGSTQHTLDRETALRMVNWILANDPGKDKEDE